jgi:hypothetical protein
MRTAQTKLLDDALTAFAASTHKLPARHPDSLPTTSRHGHATRSQ